jgi:DinB superfamily
MKTRPDRSETPDYFTKYIDKVPDGDICRILEAQSADMLTLIQASLMVSRRIAMPADKWNIREVIGHVNDTERVFVFRAFWFARGFDSALPSFDQNIAMSGAGADVRPWPSHIDEFRAVRAATLPFFKHLSSDA